MNTLTLKIKDIADLKEGRKTLDTIKCQISLEKIRSQLDYLFITRLNVSDWTDSYEEYHTVTNGVLETTVRFYQAQYKNRKTEHGLYEDYEGNQYESDPNMDDYPSHTYVPWRAKEVGLEKGLFYSLHNHNSGSALPSYGDFENLVNFHQKHSIIIGNGEIIVINNNSKKFNYGSTLRKRIKSIVQSKQDDLLDLYKSSKAYQSMESAYKNGQISVDEFNEFVKESSTIYFTHNTNAYLNILNKAFKDEKIPISLDRYEINE